MPHSLPSRGGESIGRMKLGAHTGLGKDRLLVNEKPRLQAKGNIRHFSLTGKHPSTSRIPGLSARDKLLSSTVCSVAEYEG